MSCFRFSSFFFVALWMFSGASFAGGIPLKVQLQWFDQSQFAGFYVAHARKHFQQEGLDVELLPLQLGDDPVSVLQTNGADIAISNLNNARGAALRGPGVTNIAQIFSRSGLQVLCRISQGVVRPDDMIGKKVGIWGIGDEHLVEGMLDALDIPRSQVEFVRQKPNGEDLVAGNVHCATAMSYNESISVLNAGVPLSDLIVLRPEDFNLANIEDGLYVQTARLSDPAFQQTLVRFVRALRKGWEDARIAPTLAVEAVLRVAPELDRDFQHQMLEEILNLIPEDPERFGILDLKRFNAQTENYRFADAEKTWQKDVWTFSVVNALATTDGKQALYTPSTIHYVDQFVSHPFFKALLYFGVFAYALTGVLHAIGRGYDVWGRLVLGMLSGVGGGTLRDIIIGIERQPFYYVADVTYPLGILLVVLFVSVLVWAKPELPASKGFKHLNSYSDMIGFTVLAVTGAVIAISADMPWFWAPICAALTCAGGGMLRDIVINREPLTFRGVIYEEVALVGGIFLVLGLYLSNELEHFPHPVWISVAGSMLLVFILKWMIHHYNWRYPVREAIQ
jgi:NitT/TauT family transport system substrate-binding protein